MKFALFLCLGLLASETFASAQGCRPGSSIDSIALEGLQHTRPYVVTRELAHKPTATYADSLWQIERARLLDLDLFAKVELLCSVSPTDTNRQVLHYVFAENFRWLPAPAAKKTDQDGWLLGGAVAALNLGGTGTRLETQVRLGTEPWFEDKEFALYGKSRWLWQSPIEWDAALVRTDSYNSTKTYREESFDGRLTLGWRATTDLTIILEPEFLYTQHTHSNDSTQHTWLSTRGADRIPGLVSGIAWDRRDSRMDTHKGWYQELSFGQRSGWLGGDGNYQQWLSDTRVWIPLHKRLTLLGGSLTRVRPGQVPFYERYNAGGANTLRGWQSDGSIAGKNECANNAELRAEAIPRRTINILGIQGYWALQWALGYDGSLLWDNDSPDWSHWHSGFYTGPHLVLPAIGRIRMEAGYGPRGGSFGFDIGMFEKAETLRWRSR